MSNNESIDIKDIKTTSELSQEEMDEVKGGATAGGTGTTSTNTPGKTTTGGNTGTSTPKGTGTGTGGTS